jgi:hypothetical protein
MKYLIISSSRTGSNYLSQTLHSFLPKSAHLFGEPFQELTNNDSMFKVIKNTENAVIKTHLNQLDKLSSEQIDYFLHGNWYIILLLRKNLFDCAFSAVVADALDNHNDKKYFTTTLKIKSNTFREMLDFKIEYWEKFAELKQKNLHNKIVYFEDLLFDTKKDAQLILENTKDQKRTDMIKKTPYHKITVENKEKLQKMFYKRIKNYSHPYILNNNGIFELV